MKRRIDPETGFAEVKAFAQAASSDAAPYDQNGLNTAVRFALEEFAERHQGRSVEIRVPWIGAVQAIKGTNHRRGTPPNVVEMDGETWLRLCLGLSVDESAISYSGVHADLTPYFPLFRL
ncbi:MAG: sterol carrier family protein [Actinomycetaceae bacterium]|nr:sterol carrier family protein [Arcanobacterium sp.]MDD7505484.1 sterol carrier family protein [Actinomycetaceae bacterium]MDY6143170.1 sterol carrier family protein [Arcanobacterium sp.]